MHLAGKINRINTLYKYMKNNKLKKIRQYRSRQGRSDEQYTSSMQVSAIAFGGLLIVIILSI
jgi:hypothetical protein